MTTNYWKWYYTIYIPKSDLENFKQKNQEEWLEAFSIWWNTEKWIFVYLTADTSAKVDSILSSWFEILNYQERELWGSKEFYWII